MQLSHLTRSPWIRNVLAALAGAATDRIAGFLLLASSYGLEHLGEFDWLPVVAAWIGNGFGWWIHTLRARRARPGHADRSESREPGAGPTLLARRPRTRLVFNE